MRSLQVFLFSLTLAFTAAGCAAFDPLGLLPAVPPTPVTPSTPSWETQAVDKTVYKEILASWLAETDRAKAAGIAAGYYGLFKGLGDIVPRSTKLKSTDDFNSLIAASVAELGIDGKSVSQFPDVCEKFFEAIGANDGGKDLGDPGSALRKSIGDTCQSISCACAQAYTELSR